MRTQTRNPHIDVLRGVSIIAVMLLHFTLAFGIGNSPFAELLGLRFARALIFNGNFGVTLFFVISGYLITSMSVLRWGALARIDLPTFYTYRFARIIPALLVALIVIVTLGCLGVPYFSNTDDGHHLTASYFWIAVGSILTFWHNVLMQQQGWFNYCLNIYWSLSVEEVFYLGLPAFCLLFRRTGLFVVACVALIIYGPVYRSYHLDNGLFWECGYGACFDSIALGCLSALLARRRAPGRLTATLLRALSAIGIVVTYLRGIDGHEVFGFTLISFCTAIYLLASHGEWDSNAWALRLTSPLRWLGRHSYELYLFHIVILALMRNVYARGELQPLGWAFWFAFFVILSGMLAHLVAQYISEPANLAIRTRYLNWFDRKALPAKANSLIG